MSDNIKNALPAPQSIKIYIKNQIPIRNVIKPLSDKVG